jgi:hypothetical protein
MTLLWSSCSRAGVRTLEIPCWSCCTACAHGRGPCEISVLSRSTEWSGSVRHDGSAQSRSGQEVVRQGPYRPIRLPSRFGRRNTRSIPSIPTRGASEFCTDPRKRQTPLIIFANHHEGRAAYSGRRCTEALRDSANESRLAGSERSIERDCFSSAQHTADRFT